MPTFTSSFTLHHAYPSIFISIIRSIGAIILSSDGNLYHFYGYLSITRASCCLVLFFIILLIFIALFCPFVRPALWEMRLWIKLYVLLFGKIGISGTGLLYLFYLSFHSSYFIVCIGKLLYQTLLRTVSIQNSLKTFIPMRLAFPPLLCLLKLLNRYYLFPQQLVLLLQFAKYLIFLILTFIVAFVTVFVNADTLFPHIVDAGTIPRLNILRNTGILILINSRIQWCWFLPTTVRYPFLLHLPKSLHSLDHGTRSRLALILVIVGYDTVRIVFCFDAWLQ